MTEGEKAFCKLRLRQELQRAKAASDPQSRHWHLQWVQFYDDRLDGKRRSAPDPHSPYEAIRELLHGRSHGIGAPSSIPVQSAPAAVDSDTAVMDYRHAA